MTSGSQTGTAGSRAPYPRVRVEGSSAERGESYGRQTRNRIERSVEAYREVFHAGAGWDWSRVRQVAKRYEEPIGEFGADYLEELRGIAEGSGVDRDDILAINVRTEIMYSAKARDADASLRGPECTSFAVVPPPGSCSPVVVGQNWDWLPHTFDTVVVLEAERSDGPSFVTVVEAGLLAKAGMNSAGIGLATNALATDADTGDPGVPYHVLLRAIYDCKTVSDALATLQRAKRSSSANFLLAHEDGSAIDIEAAPGDYSRLFLAEPADGLYLHTNHFLAPRFDGRDVSLWAMPDSPVRLSRIRSATTGAGRLSAETMMPILGDHAGYPSAICCHPDDRQPPTEQGATVASLVMELESRTLWLADGPPCSTPFRRLDYGKLLQPRKAGAELASA
jgi:isopenicillin-N N-acyltransferase-like protein